MKEVNVLPQNVVFIDDNPAERAAVQARFPDMRVLGSQLYHIRRILLWSAETQVPFVTSESARRTEMIQGQKERETARKQLSREDFLRSLQLKVAMRKVASAGDPLFPRAFELLNKTNQFNTTGRRWAHDECARFLSEGVVFHAFEVQDRYSQYGIVGVVVVAGAVVEQFVMSCRVLGMDVEIAVLARLWAESRERGAGSMTANAVETKFNFPCRDLFERCGWRRVDGVWTTAEDTIAQPPAHVTWVS
jgi:FkbH-like protein